MRGLNSEQHASHHIRFKAKLYPLGSPSVDTGVGRVAVTLIETATACGGDARGAAGGGAGTGALWAGLVALDEPCPVARSESIAKTDARRARRIGTRAIPLTTELAPKQNRCEVDGKPGIREKRNCGRLQVLDSTGACRRRADHEAPAREPSVALQLPFLAGQRCACAGKHT